MERELNFDCCHNTAEKYMTCSWLNGRVELITFFREKTTAVKVDGEVKCTYHNLTIKEFVRIQGHCQDIADRMERGTKAA